MPNFGQGSGGIANKLKGTFFFFSEEQRRDTRYPTLSTRNASGAVPSAQMKLGIFPIPICLSASSATNCTQILPAGTPISSVTQVSNVAQQYISRIWNNVPNPTDAATLQLDFPDINVAKFRQEIIRVDHTASDRLSFFYRFEHDKIPTEDADGTIGGRSNLPFVNRTVSDSPGKTHTANMIWTPSPNMIFEGRFTYGYGAIYIDTVGLLAKKVSPIAVNLPYESVRDTVPIVTLTGFNSLTGFSNYIAQHEDGERALRNKPGAVQRLQQHSHVGYYSSVRTSNGCCFQLNQHALPELGLLHDGQERHVHPVEAGSDGGHAPEIDRVVWAG
jgi:hypothetical protein